jgi:hypothetical protein
VLANCSTRLVAGAFLDGIIFGYISMHGSCSLYIGGMSIVSERRDGRCYVRVMGNSANGVCVRQEVEVNGRDISKELKMGGDLDLEYDWEG